MPFREDVLLEGALDLHAHGHPEFTLGMPPRVTNREWASLAVEARMFGFVLKSHVWPTTAAASLLGDLFPELGIFSSITLNSPVGGINALAVELAAQMGARLVWMPTWNARQDPPRPSIFLDRLQPWISTLSSLEPQGTDGISLLDDRAELSAEARDVVAMCAKYDLTIASGHIPIEASRLLAKHCRDQGVRFILTHPLSGSVGASLEDQLSITDLGGYIEHVFVGCMPMHQRLDPRLIVESIETVGADHCLMASDAIQGWNPPAPELLRMFIGTMLELGVTPEAVEFMTHENPRRALGIQSDVPGPPKGS